MDQTTISNPKNEHSKSFIGQKVVRKPLNVTVANKLIYCVQNGHFFLAPFPINCTIFQTKSSHIIWQKMKKENLCEKSPLIQKIPKKELQFL